MTESLFTLLPGALSAQHIPTLGVMGGGQLGRMFVQVAQRMGYRTVVLEPDARSPAAEASSAHINSAYNDADGLGQLAQLADAMQMQKESTTAHARLAEWTARKEQWRRERAEGKTAEALKPQGNDRPEFVPGK